MGSTESPENVERVCAICLGDVLLRVVGINKCARCYEIFCIHYASVFDSVGYCKYCFNDLVLERKIVTKTQEVRDIETGELLRTHSRKAVSIAIGGTDWLFEQRRINTMTDEELVCAIEYHKRDLNLMLSEQDKRRAEKAHRAAAKKILLAKKPSTVTITETVTTKPLKATATSQPKANGVAKKLSEVRSLMKLLTGKDMSDEELMKLVGGKG